MSFKKCIEDKIKEGSLGETYGKRLIEENEELLKRNNPSEAYKKLRARKESYQKRVSDNILKHANKRIALKNEMAKVDSVKGKVGVFRKEIVKANTQTQVEYNNVLKTLHRDLEGGLYKQGPANIREAIVSILDGTEPKSPAVKKIRDNIRDSLRQTKNEADGSGIIWGDLGEKYIPRSYDRAKVKALSADEFVDGLIDLVDLRGESVEGMRKILADSKIEIQTNGRVSRAEQKALFAETEFDGDRLTEIEMKRNNSREIHFKDAESHFKAMDLVGGGRDSFIKDLDKYFHGVTADIGIAKTLGPTSRKLLKEVRNDIDLALEKKMLDPNYKKPKLLGKDIAFMEAEYNVVAGTSFTGDRDNPLYKGFVSSQLWQRMSHLGSAAISALPDMNFNAMTSKLNGGSYMKPFKEYFDFFSGLGKKEQMELIEKMGYYTEIQSGNLLDETRFSIAGESDGVLRKGSDLLFQVSGLNAWTRGGKIIGQIEANGSLSRLFDNKVSWAEMPTIIKERLEDAGLNEKLWSVASKDIEVHNGRQKFINTDDLRAKDPEAKGDLYEAADALDRFVFNMKDLVVNENNITTRALTSGAALFGKEGQTGTTGKVISEALFQYKNFPTTVINNHLIPAIKNAKRGAQALGEGKLDGETAAMLSHFPLLVLGTGMMAMIPYQLKEIIKGRTPKEFSTDLFMAGLAQGGGMGLLGDLVFNDTTRYGQDTGDVLLGPYFGTLTQAIDIVSKNTKDSAMRGKGVDFESLGKDSFKFAKRNIPFGNLWYTRLFVERVLFDSIEQMVDPKFEQNLRRTKRRLAKSGQKMWWEPNKAPRPEEIVAK